VYIFRTFAIEFLHRCKRGWCISEQEEPKATSVDSVNIEKSKKDEGVEQ